MKREGGAAYRLTLTLARLACDQEMDSVIADKLVLQQQVAALTAAHEAEVQRLCADKAAVQASAGHSHPAGLSRELRNLELGITNINLI